MLRRTLSLAALGAAFVPAQAQTALLREGDALTGGPAGHTVSLLTVPAINSNGGYAVVLNSSDGVTTLSQAWGSPVDGAAVPDIFLTEQTVGPLTQTSWETLSFGIGDGGELGYSATGTGGPVGGFDSIWSDLSPIIVEGDPIAALPGKFWRFGSRPKALSDGTVVFVGGITSTAGGSTESYGLFRNDQPVHIGGDVLPGLPLQLTPSGTAFSFDFQYSRSGDHYLVEVNLDSGSATDDGAMVLDGAGLMAGGALVREASPVPVAIGGIGGENWDNFDYNAVNNNGDWLFTGDTDNVDTAVDEIIVHNGTIIHREGDAFAGGFFEGGVLGATLNEAGDVAFVWDVDIAGTNHEVLVINGTAVLMEFDEVDVDGDGMPDPGNTLADFESASQLCYAADGRFFFVADVETPGGLIEILYRIDGTGIGTPYCVAAGNSISPAGSDMSATGSASLSAANLTLRADNVPVHPGLFYFGPDQILVPFGNGFRCVGGSTTRLPVIIGFGNEFVYSIDFGTYGAVLANLGTANFQCWYRDPAAGGSAPFNLSNALEVTFVP